MHFYKYIMPSVLVSGGDGG